MEQERFFEPTAIYREYLILRAILHQEHISQKKLAKMVGVVPSMVHNYLITLQENGLIQKSGSKRKMKYQLTEAGKTRLQYLTVLYFSEVARLYKQSKENFRKVFDDLRSTNSHRLVLYGAGVIGQNLAWLLIEEGFNLVCFLDDDPKKQGKEIAGIRVLPPEQFHSQEYDAVLIASFKHADEIFQKAKLVNLKNVYIFRLKTSGEMHLERGD
ncbi:MarR family transcriptional regulator [Pseudothermotoga thermarum]|uniref:Regulatory protein MarR n=1 Tax=Pseudothermotoga thermarum DSM 5069 TaxID=688269 RepID=F7YWP4_9THEM|nr:MarR family transcriptional regulator [Pseudothermotoga thermarum]AEH52034.1 regulatory protein MarR [Pseudothermotoga thermarum DSM 5069]